MGIIFRGKERTPEEHKRLREKEKKEWEEIQMKSKRRREQGKPTPLEKPKIEPDKKLRDEGEVTGMVTVKHVNAMIDGKTPSVPEEILTTADERVQKTVSPCNKGRVCKPSIPEKTDELDTGLDLASGEDVTVETELTVNEENKVTIKKEEEEGKLHDEVSVKNLTPESDIEDDSFNLRESSVGGLPGTVAEQIEKNIREELESKKHNELYKIAQEVGVSVRGRKKELIDRIVKKQLSK